MAEEVEIRFWSWCFRSGLEVVHDVKPSVHPLCGNPCWHHGFWANIRYLQHLHDAFYLQPLLWDQLWPSKCCRGFSPSANGLPAPFVVVTAREPNPRPRSLKVSAVSVWKHDPCYHQPESFEETWEELWFDCCIGVLHASVSEPAETNRCIIQQWDQECVQPPSFSKTCIQTSNSIHPFLLFPLIHQHHQVEQLRWCHAPVPAPVPGSGIQYLRIEVMVSLLLLSGFGAQMFCLFFMAPLWVQNHRMRLTMNRAALHSL